MGLDDVYLPIRSNILTKRPNDEEDSPKSESEIINLTYFVVLMWSPNKSTSASDQNGTLEEEINFEWI